MFKKLLNIIKLIEKKFVSNNFEKIIKNIINEYFPKLDQNDINILFILTTFLIDIISYKNNFKQEESYYSVWTLNKSRDIKSVILLLLPFIDNKNNNYLFNKIYDLNQLLYAYNGKSIPSNLLELDRDLILSTYFEFGNMGIGLYPENLYDENNEKLIYKILHHNFIGLLQTLEIINGKSYINWINIIPYNLNKYNESELYKNTIARINKFKDNLTIEFLANNLYDYNGLWFGDLYNIFRIKYYYDAIKIKWLLFSYETESIQIYLIQGLNILLNMDFILNTQIFNFNDLDKNYHNIFYKSVDDLITNLNGDYINLEILKYYLIYLINKYKFTEKIFYNFILSDIDEDEEDDFNKKDINKINNINETNIIECLKYLKLNYLNYMWNFLKISTELLKNSVYGKFLIKNINGLYSINNIYYYSPFNSNIKLSEYRLTLKNLYNISKTLSHNSEWILLDENYLSLDYQNKITYFNNIYSSDPTKWLNLKSNFARQLKKAYDYNTELINITKAFQDYYIIVVFEELIMSGTLSQYVINNNYNKLDIVKYFNKNKEEWSECYYYLTNEKYKYVSYFDNIIKYNYFTYYVMNWISQINFFHHFIYHRILYLTGATGQGKSTQVPKLLTYALKIIDYKHKSKIVCTAPKIPIVENNSSRISNELSVPIDLFYYIQFKHSMNSHINNNVFHSSLLIETDGTLYNTLLENIYMYNKDNTNIYDIIIIDEAHEHNTNMDLIISLLKYTFNINNKIRLVISSATMDNDEYIYRRFFYNIDDNLLYPIKKEIYDPFLNQSFLILSQYMDRRYHISPPGETTQYTISEYYLESNINISDINLASKKAQEIGYTKVIDICNKSTFGNILFFANGAAEIKEAIQYLNLHTPQDTVAIPYYANLNHNYKNIIDNLDIQISFIKNKKENIYLEWAENYIEDNTVQYGIYKRAIIVATNIAEASLTIDKLMYVVDNGYAKVNIFDIEKNIITNSNLIVQEISESSRIQRKGRVGRISDGSIYYIYEKNARKYNKPKYKITQDDILYNILQLLLLDSLSIKYIINTFPNIIENKETKEKIIESIIFDYNNTLDLVIDKNGLFYIIHPFENKIKRNILNNIIEYKNLKINSIPENECNIMISYLKNNNIIFNNIITNKDKVNMKEIVYYYNLLESTDINNTFLYMTAYKNNCFTEIKELEILLNLINKDLTKLLNLKKKIYNKDSDIIFLYEVIKNIKKYIFNENKENIIKWANRNYFNPNIIINFIEKLKLYNSSELKKKLQNENINFYNQYLSIEDRILLSYVMAYSFQLTYKYNNSVYTNLYNNIYKVKVSPDTITNISEHLMFYLNYSIENETITVNILNKINIDIIKKSKSYELINK
jgi:hypothetical protein